MGALVNVCSESVGVFLMNANFTSEAINVMDIDVASADAEWTGADGAGSITWQGSNDKTNWCDAGDSCRISSASGHQMFTWDSRFSYKYLRASWENDSNTTGSMTITMVKKNERP